MSLEMFTCPKCEQPLWLLPDAPVGTPCPHCGHMLGVAVLDSSEMPPPWNLANAESIDLSAIVPAVDALERVPESLARELGVFPVDLDEDTLVLAVAMDVQSEELDRILFVLNREFRPVLAPPDAISSAIGLWYQ